MKRPQDVTETSKAAYVGFDRLAQREAVARFIKEETRHGRPVWISKIAANAEALGHPGLALNAGARLNEIKENGIELDEEYYTLVKLDKKIKTAKGTSVEAWMLVLGKQDVKPTAKKDTTISFEIKRIIDSIEAQIKNKEGTLFQVVEISINDAKALLKQLKKNGN